MTAANPSPATHFEERTICDGSRRRLGITRKLPDNRWAAIDATGKTIGTYPDSNAAALAIPYLDHHDHVGAVVRHRTRNLDRLKNSRSKNSMADRPLTPAPFGLDEDGVPYAYEPRAQTWFAGARMMTDHHAIFVLAGTTFVLVVFDAVGIYLLWNVLFK